MASGVRTDAADRKIVCLLPIIGAINISKQTDIKQRASITADPMFAVTKSVYVHIYECTYFYIYNWQLTKLLTILVYFYWMYFLISKDFRPSIPNLRML